MAAKLLVLVSFVTWLMGCATSTSLTTRTKSPPWSCAIDYQAQVPGIRRVALVTDSEPPRIEAVTLGHSYGEGAAGGAGTGAVVGTRAGLECAAETGGLCLVLLPVLALGGAVVGTVAGTVTGHSSDVLAEAEANAQAMLDSAYLQTEILQRTQDYGIANVDLEFIQIPSVDSESRIDSQAHGDLSAQSFDAVIEVELLRIKLENSLIMEARSRLVSTRTGDVLSENEHMFRSKSHSLEEWTENGAAQLSEAIQEGLQTLAEGTIDKNFALFPKKGREDQFTKDDSGNLIISDMGTKRIFAERPFGGPGSKYSPALLNIPEGKSAVFVYRSSVTSPFEDEEQLDVPVIVNNKYLSILASNGFGCVIVEPGKNTLIYPSQVDDNYENITIVRETLETKRNEIVYFSVKSTWGTSVDHVSVEPVIEKEAVDSIEGKWRAKMQIIK